ncbi:MAG: BamA/TamA family outer membrane protein, partial [Candidatus Delongbacteria bacterium]|nr:BamA/TamA family outer membrane protein [Candidatus Delongbacteria bacterium]
KQSSINLQFVSKFSFDDVPLTKLSTLGGTYNLRGYPDKRFTDNNMFLFQSEYDFRIYKKIAGSVYYSFGDVFDPFTDLKFNKIKQGYGLGILYDLLGTAVRIDVATSPESEIQIIATGSRAF